MPGTSCPLSAPRAIFLAAVLVLFASMPGWGVAAEPGVGLRLDSLLTTGTLATTVDGRDDFSDEAAGRALSLARSEMEAGRHDAAEAIAVRLAERLGQGRPGWIRVHVLRAENAYRQGDDAAARAALALAGPPTPGQAEPDRGWLDFALHGAPPPDPIAMPDVPPWLRDTHRLEAFVRSLRDGGGPSVAGFQLLDSIDTARLDTSERERLAVWRAEAALLAGDTDGLDSMSNGPPGAALHLRVGVAAELRGAHAEAWRHYRAAATAPPPALGAYEREVLDSRLRALQPVFQ